jgi:general stress protein 26
MTMTVYVTEYEFTILVKYHDNHPTPPFNLNALTEAIAHKVAELSDVAVTVLASAQVTSPYVALASTHSVVSPEQTVTAVWSSPDDAWLRSPDTDGESS